MKNNLIRIIVFALLLCMTLGVFAGCNNNGEVKSTEDTRDKATGQVILTDENGYQLDAIPDSLKLDREVSILYSEHLERLICVKAENVGDNVVNKAIFSRWQTVEERLNIEINWVGKDGQWNNKRDEFFKLVESTSANGDAFDAVVCYNLIPGALASKGLLQNIGETKYIDLTAPWWPQAYVREALVNNTVYGLVENSSVPTLCNLHGVFFNNELVDSYQLKSPYDYVKENTWTFDNMMEMIKGVGHDLDNNGTKSSKDFFGLVTGTEAKIETWFFAMGYRYSQRNADGEPELIMNDAAAMTEWIDRFNTATGTDDFLIYDTSHTLAFFEERAILYMSSIQLVDRAIDKSIDIDYGVVPVPKGSDSQEHYISNVANHHVAWCVPIGAENLDESSALIECMSSESYRQVAPVYFDTCVKLRYAPDERLMDMYDLIRDSITFDFCQTYSFVFSVDPRAMITNCTKGSSSWGSVWASNEGNVTSGFEDILSYYGLN